MSHWQSLTRGAWGGAEQLSTRISLPSVTESNSCKTCPSRGVLGLGMAVLCEVRWVWLQHSVQHYRTTVGYTVLMKLMLSAGPCCRLAAAPHWALSVVIRAPVKLQSSHPASLSSHTTGRQADYTRLLASNTKLAPDNRGLVLLACWGGSQSLNPCQDYFQTPVFWQEWTIRGWLTLTISGGNAQILPPNGGCGGQTGKIVSSQQMGLLLL